MSSLGIWRFEKLRINVRKVNSAGILIIMVTPNFQQFKALVLLYFDWNTKLMHIHLMCNYLSLEWITVVVRGVYDETGVTADIFNYKYSYCKQN
jgi:hypothetical protein